MTAGIAFAPGVQLPVDAVTQTFAVIAKRGQGKTYTATYLAECMLAAGNQVVAIDPVGVWYGLRLTANGKRRAFDLPVFGGAYGDLPLVPEAGRLIAQLVVERGVSVVLDVSAMRKAERVRFLADFGEELVFRKKTSRSPLHLFLEEAQSVVPQRSMPGQERMVGAFHDIVLLGRNFGLGITMVSQRPQLIDKDVLNQAECLILGQIVGPQERKAIEAWIVDQDIDLKGLVAELPRLGKRQKWIWSPQWLGITVKADMPAKATYDASKTPSAGDAKAEPKPLVKADLETLRQAMAESIAQAEADDPKALKKRIAELERELKQKPAPTVEIRDCPVLDAEDFEALKREVAEFERIAFSAVERLQEVARPLMAAARTMAEARPAPAPATPRPAARSTVSGAHDAETAPRRRAPAPSSTGSLAPVGQRILDALAELAVLGVVEPARIQVALMAGYSNVKSAGFAKAMSALSSAGYVSYPTPGTVALTDAGEAMATPPAAVIDLADFQERVTALLPPIARRVLEVLIANYPATVDRAWLASRAGYTNVKSAGFAKTLSRLSSLGFATYPSTGTVVATDLLFPEGLS